ncbi:MAG: hypothetical protein KJZ59_00995 [Pararhodobacter sp.]|nr:hypothetical protein [Pararhodobacter sp.]
MHRSDLVRAVSIELEFEREIARSRELSLFKRNPTTWELLLVLAQNHGSSSEGVYKTIDALQTPYLGNSALLKFVRERRDDGLIEFLESDKKSKWNVQLQGETLEQLIDVFEKRGRQLLEAANERPNGPVSRVSDRGTQTGTIDSMKDRRE